MIRAKENILTETSPILYNSPLVAKKDKLQQIYNHPQAMKLRSYASLKEFRSDSCCIFHQMRLGIVSSALLSQNARHVASKGVGCHA